MKNRLIVGVLVVLVAAAGVGTYLYMKPVEGGYDGVRPLVADLEEAGVVCRKLTVSPQEQTEQLEGEFGFCSIKGDTVNLHVYEDPDRVEEHVANNLAVRGDNENYFTSLVRGPNWVVDTYSEATSKMVQEALGGTIE